MTRSDKLKKSFKLRNLKDIALNTSILFFGFPNIDEFCDGYPHNVLPTPGYWVECSRAISNQGSAWTNEDRDLHEIDEGITDSPDGSLRDASVITEFEEKIGYKYI